jgi:hypothetical protein
MEIEPLSKKIFNKAVSIGITEIHLNFSGGNDEGYVDINLMGGHSDEFAQEIEEWAWQTYSYSGAGDGSDYGDDVIYDLANKRAYVSSWYTERTEGGTEETKLKISKE